MGVCGTCVHAEQDLMAVLEGPQRCSQKAHYFPETCRVQPSGFSSKQEESFTGERLCIQLFHASFRQQTLISKDELWQGSLNLNIICTESHKRQSTASLTQGSLSLPRVCRPVTRRARWDNESFPCRGTELQAGLIHNNSDNLFVGWAARSQEIMPLPASFCLPGSQKTSPDFLKTGQFLAQKTGPHCGRKNGTSSSFDPKNVPIFRASFLCPVFKRAATFSPRPPSRATPSTAIGPHPERRIALPMRTTRFHPYLDPVFKSPKYDWVAHALSLALTRTPGQHRRPCAEGVDVRFF